VDTGIDVGEQPVLVAPLAADVDGRRQPPRCDVDLEQTEPLEAALDGRRRTRADVDGAARRGAEPGDVAEADLVGADGQAQPVEPSVGAVDAVDADR